MDIIVELHNTLNSPGIRYQILCMPIGDMGKDSLLFSFAII